MFQLAVLVSLSSILTADATAQGQTGSGAVQDLSIQPGRRLPSQQGVIVFTDPREQAIGLAENTQIMGQILDDAMEGLYKGQWELFIFNAASGEPKRPTPGKIQAPHTVYLDGYGVVYQLEAPPLHQVPKPKKVKVNVRPKRKPLTVWEKTRRQLRGEKVGDAEAANAFPLKSLITVYVLEPRAKAPTKDQLIQKLLDVLAKNGHNFRHLAPEERLTVAITFRKQTSKSQPEKKGGMSGGGMGMMSMDMADGGLSAGVYGRSARMEAGMASKSNDETTGDLHMRQGDGKKAIEAYEKALRQSFPSAGDNLERYYRESDFASLDVISPKERMLIQKLSQAQIGAGNFEKAQKLVGYLRRAEIGTKAASKSKARETSSPQFPAQLVVSVKKTDLDAIAAGKIKGEEFRKRATVRYFDPAKLQRKESKNSEDDKQLRESKLPTY
jgi:tetratricopeptide (TPR) repeat protein